MPTKQTNLRIPVGILEAIDARRDADNDRTAIIISLLTSALTGEYIKPNETTANVISKLTKNISLLERTTEQLRAEIANLNRSQTISALRYTDVRPEPKDPKPDDDIEDDIEPDDDGFDDKVELEEVNSIAEEIEPPGEKLTHTEFLDRFGGCQPNGWEVHLFKGEVFKLLEVYTNAVRVLEPNGTSNLLAEAYVDFYRSTSD
jgi:hypothetical protein